MFAKTTRSTLLAACLTAALLATSATAATPAFQQAINTSAPILYYQLNEAAGPALNHGSLGAAFNATYLGAIQRNVPTAAGDSGAIFDNVNDYLESLAASPASLNGNPTFSTETLVAIRCTGTYSFYPPFIHWGVGGTGKEVYFSLHNNDATSIYAGFFDGGAFTAVGSTPVNQWMHVVWVRQGGGNASTGSTVYVNGQSLALLPDSFLCCSTQIPAVTSSPFRVNRASDSTRFTTMEMDELALYDRALSPSEVAAHFAALAPAPSTIKGDLNCDGFVSGADVDGFVTALLNPPGYPVKYPLCNSLNGDFDGSASVNPADVPLFAARLLNNPTTPFQQAILNDSPSLFYSLNEGNGTVANRGSLGSAFDAVHTGTNNLVTSPSGDGGLYFAGPGSSLYSLAPAPAAFTGNPTFSAEAVVKPECNVVFYPSMLGWGLANTGQEVFFGFPNSQAHVIYAGFFSGGITTTDSLPVAQWVHVVWTRQGGGNATTNTIVYINGQPAAQSPDPVLCCNTLTPNLASTPFRINDTANASWYFVGSLDELALYDHILTPAQVQTHFNALPH